ncbi:hypothetical protein [Sphingomonas hylomeconis]|uniref:CopG family transcriptional regulator n=1 Tax=Sphingomonas hylomeconis TaxID=1395958 RepID=A0ABV7SYZ4_9SPHN|nr:hypothetical protein [Sphingomonas hylomeconis]
MSDDAEDRLTRYARDVGRPKSVIARDWIIERLEREAIDDLLRNASKLHRADRDHALNSAAAEASAAHLRWLDAEDGGYDWGPEGPPNPR